MKILYINRCFKVHEDIDHQSDCLFIGLRELFGDSIIDYTKKSHLYTTYDEQKASELYGHGFSLSRVLPELRIDRYDIEDKIKYNYFDYVIITYPTEHIFLQDLIFKHFKSNKIIFVDGADDTKINKVHPNSLYFKRESENGAALPIHFALPTCKINFNKEKIKDFAYIKPLHEDYFTEAKDRKYFYDTEIKYYQDYNEARFGVTYKKQGWDCMRHYEIMGNGCIPYFTDIKKCPENSLVRFPKNLCSSVLHDIDVNKLNYENVYDKYIDSFEKHFMENGTTEALAKFFIRTVTNYE